MADAAIGSDANITVVVHTVGHGQPICVTGIQQDVAVAFLSRCLLRCLNGLYIVNGVLLSIVSYQFYPGNCCGLIADAIGVGLIGVATAVILSLGITIVNDDHLRIFAFSEHIVLCIQSADFLHFDSIAVHILTGNLILNGNLGYFCSDFRFALGYFGVGASGFPSSLRLVLALPGLSAFLSYFICSRFFTFLRLFTLFRLSANVLLRDKERLDIFPEEVAFYKFLLIIELQRMEDGIVIHGFGISLNDQVGFTTVCPLCQSMIGAGFCGLQPTMTSGKAFDIRINGSRANLNLCAGAGYCDRIDNGLYNRIALFIGHDVLTGIGFDDSLAMFHSTEREAAHHEIVEIRNDHTTDLAVLHIDHHIIGHCVDLHAVLLTGQVSIHIHHDITGNAQHVVCLDQAVHFLGIHAGSRSDLTANCIDALGSQILNIRTFSLKLGNKDLAVNGICAGCAGYRNCFDISQHQIQEHFLMNICGNLRILTDRIYANGHVDLYSVQGIAHIGCAHNLQSIGPGSGCSTLVHITIVGNDLQTAVAVVDITMEDHICAFLGRLQNNIPILVIQFGNIRPEATNQTLICNGVRVVQITEVNIANHQVITGIIGHGDLGDGTVAEDFSITCRNHRSDAQARQRRTDIQRLDINCSIGVTVVHLLYTGVADRAIFIHMNLDTIGRTTQVDLTIDGCRSEDAQLIVLVLLGRSQALTDGFYTQRALLGNSCCNIQAHCGNGGVFCGNYLRNIAVTIVIASCICSCLTKQALNLGIGLAVNRELRTIVIGFGMEIADSRHISLVQLDLGVTADIVGSITVSTGAATNTQGIGSCVGLLLCVVCKQVDILSRNHNCLAAVTNVDLGIFSQTVCRICAGIANAALTLNIEAITQVGIGISLNIYLTHHVLDGRAICQGNLAAGVEVIVGSCLADTGQTLTGNICTDAEVAAATGCGDNADFRLTSGSNIGACHLNIYLTGMGVVGIDTTGGDETAAACLTGSREGCIVHCRNVHLAGRQNIAAGEGQNRILSDLVTCLRNIATIQAADALAVDAGGCLTAHIVGLHYHILGRNIGSDQLNSCAGSRLVDHIVSVDTHSNADGRTLCTCRNGILIRCIQLEVSAFSIDLCILQRNLQVLINNRIQAYGRDVCCGNTFGKFTGYIDIGCQLTGNIHISGGCGNFTAIGLDIHQAGNINLNRQATNQQNTVTTALALGIHVSDGIGLKRHCATGKFTGY